MRRATASTRAGIGRTAPAANRCTIITALLNDGLISRSVANKSPGRDPYRGSLFGPPEVVFSPCCRTYLCSAGLGWCGVLSTVRLLRQGRPAPRPNSENSKAKPIAAHLKSCGIWENFGRAVEKNSKQISESASELSVRNGHFGNPLRSSNVTGNAIYHLRYVTGNGPCSHLRTTAPAIRRSSAFQ